MPKPWEITIEQAIAAGERKRERLEAADREDAPFFVRQLAQLASEEAEVLRDERKRADRERVAERERMRERRKAADRLAAPLFARQLAQMALEEDEEEQSSKRKRKRAPKSR